MVASHLVSSADRLRAFSFMLQEDRPQHWSTNDPIATRQILTTGKKKKKTHEVNPSSVAVAICCFFFLTVDRTQRWDWKNEKKKAKNSQRKSVVSFSLRFFFILFSTDGRLAWTLCGRRYRRYGRAVNGDAGPTIRRECRKTITASKKQEISTKKKRCR